MTRLPPGAGSYRAEFKRPRNLRGADWRGFLDNPEAVATAEARTRSVNGR
jgi:hypothetical protein